MPISRILLLSIALAGTWACSSNEPEADMEALTREQEVSSEHEAGSCSLCSVVQTAWSKIRSGSFDEAAADVESLLEDMEPTNIHYTIVESIDHLALGLSALMADEADSASRHFAAVDHPQVRANLNFATEKVEEVNKR